MLGLFKRKPKEFKKLTIRFKKREMNKGKTKKDMKQSRANIPSSGLSSSKSERDQKESEIKISFSEKRLASLSQVTAQLVEAIKRDALLEALGFDASMREFIVQRIKEIFEEVVSDERETFVSDLEEEMRKNNKKFGELLKTHKEVLKRIESMEEEQSSFSFQKSQTGESLGMAPKKEELLKEIDQMNHLLVVFSI